MRSPQAAPKITPPFAFHAHLGGQTSDKNAHHTVKGGAKSLLLTPKNTHRPNRNGTKKAKHREKKGYQRHKKRKYILKKIDPSEYIKLIKAQPHHSLSVRVMAARGLNPARPAILLNANS